MMEIWELMNRVLKASPPQSHLERAGMFFILSVNTLFLPKQQCFIGIKG